MKEVRSLPPRFRPVYEDGPGGEDRARGLQPHRVGRGERGH
ncbi:MAG TPA: hypothetical protein VFS10_11475 [Pyrinomonadaceae bacterium]|nr:hypothetical protein [Pyrinomonadaceae bacterium]